jgi:4a-hydroxytetrahydrobiopterin dehydratase
MKKISTEEAQKRLENLEGWQLDGDDAIQWEHTYEDFDEAMEAINAIAEIARELDHHPELSNTYNNVHLRLTTHDAGGLTENDFSFAKAVNNL